MNIMNKKQLKKKAVYSKGGSCILCGYNRCLAALHFHHVNAFEKEFNISSGTSWVKIEIELAKCVLLCANCHAECESGMVNIEVFDDLEL